MVKKLLTKKDEDIKESETEPEEIEEIKTMLYLSLQVSTQQKKSCKTLHQL